MRGSESRGKEQQNVKGERGREKNKGDTFRGSLMAYSLKNARVENAMVECGHPSRRSSGVCVRMS